MTPDSTPREGLYIETGLLDVQANAESKRLNMKARLNRDKSELMAKVLSNPECMWEKDTAELMNRKGLLTEDLEGSKYRTKAVIKKAISKNFKVITEENSLGKSKMKYFLEGKGEWNPGKRAKYMSELTRKQTSTIFKARTRMIKVKGNYKNGHTSLLCRMCKNEEETQTHILESCPEVHKDNAIRTPKQDLFSEDIGTLKQVAINIDKILDKLGDVVC